MESVLKVLARCSNLNAGSSDEYASALPLFRIFFDGLSDDFIQVFFIFFLYIDINMFMKPADSDIKNDIKKSKMSPEKKSYKAET